MKKGVLVFLIYSGITLVLTYPLILQMASVLPNDAGDPSLNTWILWWNSQTMPFSEAWWNAPAFFPAPGVISFSEHLLGLSLLTTPLYWMGADPQTAYNVVFLLTFPLSALGGYLLGYELTKRHDAAFIAGLLFGFAPYRIAHLPQIQSLASFPMPFALLGLHRYLRDPRPKWLALFAAGWFLQGICNGYYLLFFSVFVGMWILWFASPWWRPRQFLAISLAWIVAAIPILPLLLRYRAIHASFGFAREFGTIRDFGADVASLLYATDHLALWGSLQVFRHPEGELFPGLTVALLLAAGAVFVRDSGHAHVNSWTLIRRILIVLTAATAIVSASAVVVGPWRLEPFGIRLLSVANPIKPLTFSLVLALLLALTSPALRRAYRARSVIGFYAVAGFLMWLCSLGPAPTLMGHPFMYRGPYALLMYLPGFNSLRVPARFWMTVTLCLAVIGAIVFARLTERLGRMALLAAGIVAFGILADTWMAAMPLAETPKTFPALKCAQDGGPIVELPLGYTYPDVAAMYRQMSHGRPLVNGYSGYFPPHYAALRFGLTLRDHDVLTELAARGVTNVIVDREPDPDGRWDNYVASYPQAMLVCTEGKQSLYRLSPVEAVKRSAATGTPIPIAVIRPNVNEGAATAMTDQDRTTRWESGPQSNRTAVEIDLGGTRTVAGIDLLLGPFVEDFPRGLLIEVSEDGESWREVWQGGSAGLAFAGAFESPREVPLRYRFPPTPARMLRMKLTKNDDTYYWSIAEMKVSGP
ncbi:MAG: discoidin domain-containing protein [Vicinamibacterales bacterium]